MRVNSRAIAAQILAGVIRDRRSLAELLRQKIPDTLAARDQALVKEYCFGVLRWYERLKSIAALLVYKPLKSREQEIAALLLVGLYQLIYLNTPSHAAVSETVAAAQVLKKAWAKGLINQGLRQFLKRKNFFLEKADADETGRFSHPQWMIDAIKAAWPGYWESILTENNHQAPLFLRVNLRKNSREEYRLRLRQHQINSFIVEDLPAALRLEQPLAVELLPGFSEGRCSVQDPASQYIVELLNLKPQQRILDACAAPGGKTCHILEAAPDLAELIAIDQNADRLRRVEENIVRLQLSSTALRLLAADASDPKQWWDGRQFDRILLDAPCSGTGVIRRHPDIKILREPSDIMAGARQQMRLLTVLWPLLKPGGHLLYTTCSIFTEENTETIESFCRDHHDAVSLPVALKPGIPQKIGHQLLPVAQGSDGFYYALLTKSCP